jgi:uncharacterized membrane protein YfcA
MSWIEGITDALPGIAATTNLGLSSALTLMSVLFLAGFVSGLSGFAFAAVAACILWLLPPLQAVPLVMLLSTCNQLLSAGGLHRDMRLLPDRVSEGALPYILGGLIGVPIGLSLLWALPSAVFAAFLGVFLTVYATFSLLKPDTLHLKVSGWRPAAVAGALGGIVGGFSGFPGSIPVVYLGLRGKAKAETRGIVQPYILTLQVLSLAILATTKPEVFGGSFWLLAAITLPPALTGTLTGVGVYRRMSDVNFRRAVMLLLIVSGTSLVAKSIVQFA